MKNFRWMLIAAGLLAAGSLAYSLAPDLYRYLRIRSM